MLGPLIFPPDSAQKSGAEESSSAAEGSIAAIVGALLTLMVVMGIAVQRRHRQPPKEGAEKPGGNELAAAAASELKNISASVAVMLPVTIAATSAGNRLWPDFRRVVSFDLLYYDNPIIKLDDLALHDVYALLVISCPPGTYLDHLRAVGGRWLNLPFSKSNEEDLVDDAVDFFMAAMPDCLVERAIDLLALFEERAEDTEALYALIDEVFSSGPRKFLVRDKSGNARMNADAAIREVHCPEPEYFDVGNDGTEGMYEFGSGGGEGSDEPDGSGQCYTEIFAGTPFANAPVSNDYDLVSGSGEAVEEATYDVAASTQEDTYSTAQAEEESTYSFADSGKSSKDRPGGTHSFGSTTKENTYALGSAPEENKYSLGSAPEVNDYSLGSAPQLNDYSLGSAPEKNNYSLGSSTKENDHSLWSAPQPNDCSLGSALEENNYSLGSAPDERAHGVAASRGNTHSLQNDPTGELSKSFTLTMDAHPKEGMIRGLRFKSMHRSNPLVSHGNSAGEDTDEGMEEQQAESPAPVGPDHTLSMSRTESYLGLGDGMMVHGIQDPKKMASQEAGPSTAPPRALTFTEEAGMLETTSHSQTTFPLLSARGQLRTASPWRRQKLSITSSPCVPKTRMAP